MFENEYDENEIRELKYEDQFNKYKTFKGHCSCKPTSEEPCGYCSGDYLDDEDN